jgi:hypothetical protein
MKLAEFLAQGQQLRRQDRTLAIAYFEQCLQNITISNVDLSTIVRIWLDLAVELIATRQPESLKKAQELVQQAGDTLNQNLETNDAQKAYWLYATAIFWRLSWGI